jgi:pimeloyl-ACP methyl ester carboxylesterase
MLPHDAAIGTTRRRDNSLYQLQITILTDSGHLVMIDRPDAIVGAVRTFIDGIG